MTYEPADTRRINTEFGPLEVPVYLLNLWNQYGWPRDEVLEHMVRQSAAEEPR